LLVFKTSAFNHSATSPVSDWTTANCACSAGRIQPVGQYGVEKGAPGPHIETLSRLSVFEPVPAVAVWSVQRIPEF